MTPDEILDAAPTTTRLIKMEANVIAYFGDFFHAWRQGVRREITAGPAMSVHTTPSNTASAHSLTQK
jgi:nitrogenase molybdenum-iron protein alpha/beta subunit